MELGLPGHCEHWLWQGIDSVATDCWFKDFTLYMLKHHLELHDTLPELVTCRQTDQFLIHKSVVCGFHGEELRMLNECHKFLQVVTLSEITTADGLSIEDWAWMGK